MCPGRIHDVDVPRQLSFGTVRVGVSTRVVPLRGACSFLVPLAWSHVLHVAVHAGWLRVPVQLFRLGS